jgi:nitrite reductase (NO-forming)
MAEAGATKRSTLIGGAIALVLCVAGGVGLGFVLFPHEGHDPGPPGAVEARPAPPSARRVQITLADFTVTPASVEIPRGEEIAFNIFNGGELQHDFKVEGEVGIERLEPGRNASFSYGPVDETVLAWCTIPGHREQGMELKIIVTEP